MSRLIWLLAAVSAEKDCTYTNLVHTHGVMKIYEKAQDIYKHGDSCKVFCMTDYKTMTKATCNDGTWELNPEITCEKPEKPQCSIKALYQYKVMPIETMKMFYDVDEVIKVRCMSATLIPVGDFYKVRV